MGNMRTDPTIKTKKQRKVFILPPFTQPKGELLRLEF